MTWEVRVYLDDGSRKVVCSCATEGEAKEKLKDIIREGFYHKTDKPKIITYHPQKIIRKVEMAEIEEEGG